jgi:hypothetical protein
VLSHLKSSISSHLSARAAHGRLAAYEKRFDVNRIRHIRMASPRQMPIPEMAGLDGIPDDWGLPL